MKEISRGRFYTKRNLWPRVTLRTDDNCSKKRIKKPFAALPLYDYCHNTAGGRAWKFGTIKKKTLYLQTQ